VLRVFWKGGVITGAVLCLKQYPRNSNVLRDFGEVEAVEAIAIGASIQDLARLRKRYGSGRWRKLKGIATVRIKSGAVRRAEIHRYEAHGIGKVKFKIKQFLD